MTSQVTELDPRSLADLVVVSFGRAGTDKRDRRLSGLGGLRLEEPLAKVAPFGLLSLVTRTVELESTLWGAEFGETVGEIPN
jgi:hypothetical protein